MVFSYIENQYNYLIFSVSSNNMLLNIISLYEKKNGLQVTTVIHVTTGVLLIWHATYVGLMLTLFDMWFEKRKCQIVLCVEFFFVVDER